MSDDWQRAPAKGKRHRVTPNGKDGENRPPRRHQDDSNQLDTYNAGHRERFSTRKGKGGHQEKWVSEQEQTLMLSEKLSKLNSKREAEGGWAMTNGVLPRNALVAQFENEPTDHFEEQWRKLPVLPTVEELSMAGVELSTNIVDGPFENVEEYLQTHYELLREDSIAGLRDAVSYIRSNPSSEDTPGVAIYENVHIIGMTFAENAGICLKVTFSLNRAGMKVRWAQSKRLVPGSLVCLSDDEFMTFRVATVAARPMEGVEKNPHEVDLLLAPDEIEIDASKQMMMIESKNGYFEAYKWTLRALQRMTPDKFPLHEHICLLENNVPAPSYVEANHVYNLTSIFPDATDKEVIEEVNILKAWPQKTETSMDSSQLDALKTILTKRVAVIQGPPGTGKTFTSVMALHAILQNMTEDDPPIIVACQTNHALDQILRHVYKFESNIIRLGGRTQDKDEILNRTLFNVRKGSSIKIQGSNMRLIQSQLFGLGKKIRTALEPLCADLISPDALFALGLITKGQRDSFDTGAKQWVLAKDDEKPDSPMSAWLGDSIVKFEIEPDYEGEVEEADIEYEALKDLEAEFLSGANPATDDKDRPSDELYGIKLPMKHKFRVPPQHGVQQEEIDRALRKNNLWDLANYMRAAVYCHLRSEVLKKIFATVKQLSISYSKCVQQFKTARMERDSALLCRSKLVGMTTTGLSKYRSLVVSTRPKIVLIEEAAEVLEGPVVVACLPSVEHLILVGDHKQLRGKCSVQELGDEPYNLSISLFERWVNNNLPYVSLRTQRRMRPEIREILTPIYKDQLKDHNSVMNRDPIQGMGNVNMWWYSHSWPEDVMDGSPSKINSHEAQMINKFVEHLIYNGMQGPSITILTFYTGQRSILARTMLKNPNLKDSNVKIATVDSYQGEENDVIILSLVRSNDTRTIGFLNNENRVCVALSRAQRGFYIFGNAQMVTNVSNLWWDIGNVLNRPPAKIGFHLPLTCHKHKARVLIENVNDFDGLHGGCQRRCGENLPCRHKCPLSCHPFDHGDINCVEPCNRILACGHPCERDCFQECDEACARCAGRARRLVLDRDADAAEEEDGQNAHQMQMQIRRSEWVRSTRTPKKRG